MEIKECAVAACVLLLAGCSGGGDADSEGVASSGESVTSAAQQRERGGTVTVGDQSWTFVPSMQCSVYPGNVVAIAGHAESEPETEIVIDHDPGGLKAVRIGSDSGADGWYSLKGSLTFEIEGKQVRGSGDFSSSMGGAGQIVQGEFIIDC